MNTRHLIWLLNLGFALFLGCSQALASIDHGAIRGTLRDVKGAVVPGVPVTVTNVGTLGRYTAVTDSAGFYLVPELIPGTYRIRVEIPGFVLIDVTGVAVTANNVATIDLQLRPGRTTESVTVVATNPLVETTAANFSVPVDNQLVEDLPLLGRDIQSLTQLIPGVTQSFGPPGSIVSVNGGQFGGFPDPSHILGSNVSVNGGQAGANVWYLDGSLNSAQGVDNTVVNPPPDAISEFQAVTESLAPEYGRAAGGVFNVALKSGTNVFHGNLYEYNRNSFSEAHNPFSATSPTGQILPPTPVNWNQFGGTIGGPLTIPHVYNGRNRTFFFFAWDASILHEQTFSLFTVPTMLERQGNFSELPSVVQYGLYDPLTTKYSPSLGTYTRQPFTNSSGGLAASIPPNRIDPVAFWYLNQYPAPNFLDPRQQNAAAGGCLNTCNNYEGYFGSGQTTQSIVVRVDHEISEKSRLFVEWLYNPTSYSLLKLPWTGATAPLMGFNGAYPFDVGNQIVTLGNTYAFSSTLMNEFRLSYSRQHNVPLPVPNALQDNAAVAQHTQGLNIPVDPPLQSTPQIEINAPTGLQLIGPPSNNLIQITQAVTVTDNLTKVVSKHTLKAGFMFRTDLTGTEFPNQSVLTFGLLSPLTDNPVTAQGGNAFAQFLLGAVDQGNPYVGSSFIRYVATTYGSTHTWSAYVQDDYRVTSRLTLNYGLRYDIYGWFNTSGDDSSIFNFSLQNPADPVRNGAIAYFGTPAHPSGRAFPPHYRDFAPRLNFAYSLSGSGKTVIRGGIDEIYTNGNTQNNGAGVGASEAPGYNQYQSWVGDATHQGLTGTGVVPAFILSQGAPTLPGYINPKPGNLQFVGPGYSNLTVVNFKPDPYVWLWNLQVQHQLPGNVLASVGYVGSHGVNLIGNSDWNYNHVPTATELKYRSQLIESVPMPADLARIWGQNYYMSQKFLPYPQYANGAVANEFSDNGWSKYEALQVRVEHQYSHGLSVDAAYTNQKKIVSANLGGFESNVFTGGAGLGSGRGRLNQVAGGGSLTAPQNLDDPNADHSLSADDIPQILNVALIYELPFGPGKLLGGGLTGIPRALVRGWRISANLNAQRGTPLQIDGPCNNLTCRVNLIGDPSAGQGSKSRTQLENQWFNPGAFEAVFGSNPFIINLATNGTPAQQDPYNEFWRFGTAGYLLGNARTPGFWGGDMALMKDFKISESALLQFIVQSYNVFNHQALGLPNTQWCLPPNPDGSTDAVHQFGCEFGEIYHTAVDPRSFQFGLRFSF
jgi:Carboxypeptidase regulatory-like domain